jgi:flagellar assembly factor FliW
LKIQTTRFGEMDIDEAKIITFTEPIFGFPDSKKFVFLDNTNSLFKWLQSTEKKELAFVMMDPLHIMKNYEVSVAGEFIKDLNLSSIDKAVVLCIVNIANECASVTANLVGPVILNPEKMLARQVVLLNSPYGLKHSILGNLQAAGAGGEK